MRNKFIFCIKCDLTLLDTKDGGRTKPIYSGYRSRIKVLNSAVSTEIKISFIKELVNPGENFEGYLGVSHINKIGNILKPNLNIEIVEGNRKIGYGVVKQIIGYIPKSESYNSKNEISILYENEIDHSFINELFSNNNSIKIKEELEFIYTSSLPYLSCTPISIYFTESYLDNNYKNFESKNFENYNSLVEVLNKVKEDNQFKRNLFQFPVSFYFHIDNFHQFKFTFKNGVYDSDFLDLVMSMINQCLKLKNSYKNNPTLINLNNNLSFGLTFYWKSNKWMLIKSTDEIKKI